MMIYYYYYFLVPLMSEVAFDFDDLHGLLIPQALFCSFAPRIGSIGETD